MQMFVYCNKYWMMMIWWWWWCLSRNLYFTIRLTLIIPTQPNVQISDLLYTWTLLIHLLFLPIYLCIYIFTYASTYSCYPYFILIYLFFCLFTYLLACLLTYLQMWILNLSVTVFSAFFPAPFLPSVLGRTSTTCYMQLNQIMTCWSECCVAALPSLCDAPRQRWLWLPDQGLWGCTACIPKQQVEPPSLCGMYWGWGHQYIRSREDWKKCYNILIHTENYCKFFIFFLDTLLPWTRCVLWHTNR